MNLLTKLSKEILTARRLRNQCVPGTHAFELANRRVQEAFTAWNTISRMTVGAQ